MRIDIFGCRNRVEKEIRAAFADFVATTFSKIEPASLVAPNFSHSSRTETQDTVLHLWCLGALEYFCMKHKYGRPMAVDLYREHLIAFRDANSPPEADGVLRALVSYFPKLEFADLIERGRNCAKSWDAGRIANPSVKLQTMLERAKSVAYFSEHVEDFA